MEELKKTLKADWADLAKHCAYAAIAAIIAVITSYCGAHPSELTPFVQLALSATLGLAVKLLAGGKPPAPPKPPLLPAPEPTVPPTVAPYRVA